MYPKTIYFGLNLCLTTCLARVPVLYTNLTTAARRSTAIGLGFLYYVIMQGRSSIFQSFAAAPQTAVQT